MSHVVVVLSFEVRSSSCFFFSVENCVSAQFRCVALASRRGVCKDLPRVGQDQHLHYLVFGVCDLFSWELFTVKCVLSDFFLSYVNILSILFSDCLVGFLWRRFSKPGVPRDGSADALPGPCGRCARGQFGVSLGCASGSVGSSPHWGSEGGGGGGARITLLLSKAFLSCFGVHA